MTLFNFNKQSDITDWKTIADIVMGGTSNSYFSINDAGFGVFSGKVSLENNGGFAMVQYHFDTKDVSDFSKVCLHVKGDGKTYQFRIKEAINDKHAYCAIFNSGTEWTTIEVKFNSMRPKFRGNFLDIPNFTGKQISQIAFLIGNKKEESFNLEIANITLK